MITVTSGFKTAVKNETKQIKAFVGFPEGDIVYDDDDLVSLKISSVGGICKTVMRQAEAEYMGTHNFLGQYVYIGIGVVLADLTTEYITYGKFLVTEQTTEKGSDKTRIKMYDQMYDALQTYALTPTYPTTVTDMVGLIGTALGWTVTTPVPNGTIPIASELFSESKLTYRQILDQVAEATGTMIYFDVDDTLKYREVSKTSLEDTLNASNLMSLTVGTSYGPINSLVLSRYPQEDNIVEKDDASIALSGLTEIKFYNNLIVDPDRETYITPIFTTLNGLAYYPIEAKTEGLLYFQVGDRIKVVDTNANEFETVLTEISISVGAGIQETFKSSIPSKGSTNYSTAGIIGQTIKNTEIIVDKQEGLITSINADIGTVQGDITTLTQSVSDLQLQVEGIGGTNMILNSVGLKGTLEEWQVLDINGDLVDARNTGTILQNVDVNVSTESKRGISLTDQFITQTINVISGETYTLYFRYKKTDDFTFTLTGLGTITLDGADNEWVVYKNTFTASGSALTLRFESTTAITAIVSDIVVKLGDCSGWSQAPNEVYGSNYRFDKEGFEITSLTDTFKSVLDNTKLAVYDTAGGTDKNIMVVSKDEGKITNLVAQDSLTVQRYENPTYGLKVLPTATGIYFVIQD